jgi:hypothetical protein
MPVPAHSPSLVLDCGSTLTPQDRHDITQAFEGTQPEVSLEGGDRVAQVLAAGLRGLLDRIPSSSCAEVKPEIDRLERVQALLSQSQTTWDAPLKSGDLTLWSVARRIDAETADPRLLLRLGAIYFNTKVSFARPSQAALRAVLEAAKAAGTDRAGVTLTVLEQVTNDALAKAMSKLLPRARSQQSATSTLAERRIELRWNAARSFTNEQRESGLDGDITADEVIETAGHVRRRAEGGDILAYLVAMAHWLGLWLWELLHLEVFGLPGTGLIRIAEDCTHSVIDLRGVLGDLAQGGCDRCKSSGLVTIVVFPLWIATWLRAMRIVRPDAKTMHALTGLDLPRSHSRVPGVPQAHARRLTVRRFVDARSAPLTDKADQHVIALGNLDFALAEKSAYPYPAVALAEIYAVQQLRARLLDWGELCEMPAMPNEHVGSRITPLRSATVELVHARQRVVHDAPHGPNAGWDLLIDHHNQLIRYVLLLCTLAWMLRGRLAYALPASLMRLFVALGWRDKAVPEAGCPPAPLVCGSVLRQQLNHLHAHILVLIKRLGKRAGNDPARLTLVKELNRITTGDAGVALLQVIEGTILRPAGAQDLGAELPIDWKFSADALRHFGTDGHRELGTSASMIELLLRHAGNGFELFSTSCGVSLREWEADAGHAQDRLLLSLDAHPIAGLVATLAAKRP